PQSVRDHAVNANIDDAHGSGFKLLKLQIFLTPSAEVIKARNQMAIEEAQANSETKNNETRQKLIAKRLKFHHKGVTVGKDHVGQDLRATTTSAAQELNRELIINAGDATINEGSTNVTQNRPSRRNRS
nr:hypothetical protein [bacterium]